MKEIPVYVIAGFLDSGKTQFINGILQDGFAMDGHTLLLSCEEGETDYDKRFLANVDLVSVEEFEDITPLYLHSLEKTYHPDQVLIEMNGMWSLEELATAKLPQNWVLYQIMVTVDSTTFDSYLKNMGQLVMEKLMPADMIVFNRCTKERMAELRKKNFRMVNRTAEIFLEAPDGATEDYRDGTVSAFDLSQDHLTIADNDFGAFYVEVMDETDMYLGKTVTFKGRVCQDDRFLPYFTAGRHAMVCCEEDIAFLALPCAFENHQQFKTRDWVEITATVTKDFWEVYNEEGPILVCSSVTPCDPPAEELVSF